MAWRTRTSLKGFWSVRIERWLKMLATTSIVRRFGRRCFTASLICAHSVRKM